MYGVSLSCFLIKCIDNDLEEEDEGFIYLIFVIFPSRSLKSLLTFCVSVTS